MAEYLDEHVNSGRRDMLCRFLSPYLALHSVELIFWKDSVSHFSDLSALFEQAKERESVFFRTNVLENGKVSKTVLTDLAGIEKQ